MFTISEALNWRGLGERNTFDLCDIRIVRLAIVARIGIIMRECINTSSSNNTREDINPRPDFVVNRMIASTS